MQLSMPLDCGQHGEPGSAGDSKRTNEWNGFRTLNSRLDELAKRIVEEECAAAGLPLNVGVREPPLGIE